MNAEIKKEKKSKFKIFSIVLTILVVLLLVCFFSVRIYVQYLEISDVGNNFIYAYFKNLLVDVTVFILSSLILFCFFQFNTYMVKKNLNNESITTNFLSNKNYFNFLNFSISIITSVFNCRLLSKNFLLCFNAIQFNRVEEVSGLDLSFFFFVKPFVDSILRAFISFMLVSLIYVFICYFLMYVDLSHRNLKDMVRNKRISTHLLFLILLLMLIFAASLWMRSYDLVYSEFAGLDGAGFVDVVMKMNLYKFISIILLFSILFVSFSRKNRIKSIVISFIVISGSVLLGVILSFCLQSFYVSPNEVMVEYPYIENNIKATRFGYNIEDVKETTYHVDNTVSKSDFSDNSIVTNTRIIDYNSALTATNQIQAMRSYYRFSDIDVALYDVNGKKEMVAIGVRELDKSNIEDSAKNYTNEKLKFTHGYGAVMMATNKVTVKGEPHYYIKDMTLLNDTGSNEIVQPRIYYGEQKNDYSIVNTNTSELDYSEGVVDYVFSYDADSGIKLNFLNKVIYSVIKMDYKMLVTNQIHSESRLLVNTNIIERAKLVAPFLKYDPDPQCVITDGGIKWVINAYTYSDLLPYSADNDGINYIRNSVKVVIDAYTGDTKFYIIDKKDPVINTYKKTYPDIFENENFPDELAEKSSYPEWLFSLQSKVYALYHTTEAAAFYNNSDMYQIANEKYNNDIRQILPYYNYLKLEEFNNNSEEMVLMLPYTMYNRENMVSWIAVGNSGKNYGKIIAYKFPKNLSIYGPLQIENLIDNDSEISKELALWNTGEGNVIRGNLLVIPVNNTILYIEPVYLNSENQAALPVLQRVIVALGDRIAMDTSVQGALSRVLSTDIVYSESTEYDEFSDDVVDEEILNNIINSYYDLEKNAAEGNWNEFGNSMNYMKENILILENYLK
ncbi:MAG: UPF0182 family protein [Clostridia bacterium]|nr:UPF0182 family protein [Clostridia bacterium]